LIAALVRVKERVPELTIVADHLPNQALPADATGKVEYRKNLERLAKSPGIFIKLSEIPQKIDGKVVLDPTFYRSKLDDLWDIFGENRVIFGSDWPNSDHLADYTATFRLVKSYMATKSAAAQEKYFWRNSIAAYRWKPRTKDQASL